MQVHDPWAKSSTAGAPKPPPVRATTIPPGPVEQQLKQHEVKIHELRRSLQDLSNKQDKMQVDVMSHTAQVKDGVLQFVKRTAVEQEQKTQCCFLELKQLLVDTQDRNDDKRPAKMNEDSF